MPTTAHDQLSDHQTREHNTRRLTIRLSNTTRFQTCNKHSHHERLHIRRAVKTISTRRQHSNKPRHAMRKPTNIPHNSKEATKSSGTTKTTIRSRLLRQQEGDQFGDRNHHHRTSRANRFKTQERITNIHQPCHRPQHHHTTRYLKTIRRHQTSLHNAQLYTHGIQYRQTTNEGSHQNHRTILQLEPTAFQRFQARRRRPTFQPTSYTTTQSRRPHRQARNVQRRCRAQ